MQKSFVQRYPPDANRRQRAGLHEYDVADGVRQAEPGQDGAAPDLRPNRSPARGLLRRALLGKPWKGGEYFTAAAGSGQQSLGPGNEPRNQRPYHAAQQ